MSVHCIWSLSQETVSLAQHKDWEQLAWLCPQLATFTCRLLYFSSLSLFNFCIYCVPVMIQPVFLIFSSASLLPSIATKQIYQINIFNLTENCYIYCLTNFISRRFIQSDTFLRVDITVQIQIRYNVGAKLSKQIFFPQSIKCQGVHKRAVSLLFSKRLRRTL